MLLSEKNLSTPEGIVHSQKGCYSSNRFVDKIFTTRMSDRGEQCWN